MINMGKGRKTVVKKKIVEDNSMRRNANGQFTSGKSVNVDKLLDVLELSMKKLREHEVTHSGNIPNEQQGFQRLLDNLFVNHRKGERNLALRRIKRIKLILDGPEYQKYYIIFKEARSLDELNLASERFRVKYLQYLETFSPTEQRIIELKRLSLIEDIRSKK
jgi:hypothetical protein